MQLSGAAWDVPVCVVVQMLFHGCSADSAARCHGCRDASAHMLAVVHAVVACQGCYMP